jgi:hypothetical protein
MANAVLDARQEGDSYRRIEVITAEPAATMDGRGEGSDRRGELRGGRQHLRRGCPWATHGLATSVCSSKTQQADPGSVIA